MIKAVKVKHFKEIMLSRVTIFYRYSENITNSITSSTVKNKKNKAVVAVKKKEICNLF